QRPYVRWRPPTFRNVYSPKAPQSPRGLANASGLNDWNRWRSLGDFTDRATSIGYAKVGQQHVLWCPKGFPPDCPTRLHVGMTVQQSRHKNVRLVSRRIGFQVF